MASCRKARNRYHEYLEENQKKKTKDSNESAKELLSMEIEELEGKIDQLKRTKSVLDEKFDEMVLSTETIEKSEDVEIVLTQARAVKRKSMDRGGDIKKLSDTLAVMHDKRRKMV